MEAGEDDGTSAERALAKTKVLGKQQTSGAPSPVIFKTGGEDIVTSVASAHKIKDGSSLGTKSDTHTSKHNTHKKKSDLKSEAKNDAKNDTMNDARNNDQPQTSGMKKPTPPVTRSETGCGAHTPMEWGPASHLTARVVLLKSPYHPAVYRELVDEAMHLGFKTTVLKRLYDPPKTILPDDEMYLQPSGFDISAPVDTFKRVFMPGNTERVTFQRKDVEGQFAYRAVDCKGRCTDPAFRVPKEWVGDVAAVQLLQLHDVMPWKPYGGGILPEDIQSLFGVPSEEPPLVGGKRKKIYYLDSGVDGSHPAFSARRLTLVRRTVSSLSSSCDLVSFDPTTDRADMNDTVGHGTVVAGAVFAANPHADLCVLASNMTPHDISTILEGAKLEKGSVVLLASGMVVDMGVEDESHPLFCPPSHISTSGLLYIAQRSLLVIACGNLFPFLLKERDPVKVAALASAVGCGDAFRPPDQEPRLSAYNDLRSVPQVFLDDRALHVGGCVIPELPVAVGTPFQVTDICLSYETLNRHKSPEVYGPCGDSRGEGLLALPLSKDVCAGGDAGATPAVTSSSSQCPSSLAMDEGGSSAASGMIAGLLAALVCYVNPAVTLADVRAALAGEGHFPVFAGHVRAGCLPLWSVLARNCAPNGHGGRGLATQLCDLHHWHMSRVLKDCLPPFISLTDERSHELQLILSDLASVGVHTLGDLAALRPNLRQRMYARMPIGVRNSLIRVAPF